MRDQKISEWKEKKRKKTRNRKKSRKKKKGGQNRQYKRKQKGIRREESNRLKGNGEERKLFRKKRTERWSDKGITRSKDRTGEKNEINTLFSNFQSKEKEKKARKKKVSDVVVVCTINKIFARVNQPQVNQVKNCKKHKVNLRI